MEQMVALALIAGVLLGGFCGALIAMFACQKSKENEITSIHQWHIGEAYATSYKAQCEWYKERSRRSAISMLARGVSSEDVMALTRLTESEISEILKT